ncbi:hypothetical protein BC938DRAFT_472953 [Jimgerdemannia flammicorona]|uniref:Uncharacterized protein n=1 Tax=Jimgerdemannia flammicorona TaxID=994334 RepID=A0A433Q526_9FUNG|nr:hypothetical protein BC938DRAFT_472953 [Jimgerdemannia flammicorona]
MQPCYAGKASPLNFADGELGIFVCYLNFFNIELRTITDKQLAISANRLSTSETILQELVQEICDDALWNTNT